MGQTSRSRTLQPSRLRWGYWGQTRMHNDASISLSYRLSAVRFPLEGRVSFRLRLSVFLSSGAAECQVCDIIGDRSRKLSWNIASSSVVLLAVYSQLLIVVYPFLFFSDSIQVPVHGNDGILYKLPMCDLEELQTLVTFPLPIVLPDVHAPGPDVTHDPRSTSSRRRKTPTTSSVASTFRSVYVFCHLRAGKIHPPSGSSGLLASWKKLCWKGIEVWLGC
jgi:hypothetical protein